jgi:glycosyltransferase involved in cell wall biosynthesis
VTPISAVIITFNEQHNIGRCLQSLQEIADEVVVVDSFSTDNTEAICRQYSHVKFIQREWKGYAPTKNWANEQAVYPYILSIDADEAPDENLRNVILTLKETSLSGAYELNRITNYCGHWVKHCDWYPDKKVRLFKKGKALWEGDFVHETLKVDVNEKITPLKGHLLHYSYHTLQDHRSRIEKYATLHAQKMHAEGKTVLPGKALFSALWKFKQIYFFKLGFLDGKAGFNIARFSAQAVYLKYQKLNQLNRKVK